jgi:hypothetical protein
MVERGCKVWRLGRWKHSSWVSLFHNKHSDYTAKLITIENFQRQVTLSSSGQKFLNLYDREFSVVCFTMPHVRENKLESIWRKSLIGMSSRHSSGQSEQHHRKYYSRLLLSGRKFNEEFSWVKLLRGLVKATPFAVEFYLRLSLRFILEGGVNSLTVVQKLSLTHPYIKAWDKLWIHGR